MSVQKRRILAVLCIVAWAVWWLLAINGPFMAAWLAQHVAYILSGTFVMGWFVSPVIATARIWYDIGRLEQAKQCGHEDHSAEVVPFRSRRPHS